MNVESRFLFILFSGLRIALPLNKQQTPTLIYTYIAGIKCRMYKRNVSAIVNHLQGVQSCEV